MRHKALAILGIVALVCSALLAAPAAASDPAPPTDLIAVDMDPYFKSLTGEAAYTKIRAETDASAAELAAAVAASEQDPSNRGQGKKSDTSGVSAAGVGDVEFLYADGWREFTLWALGDSAEIWVANDLSYCPGDPRPPQVVTQEQVDYLLDQFDSVIYPSNTTHFGFTEDRDGSGGEFAAWGYDWYQTDNPQRVMILVYNIIDEG